MESNNLKEFQNWFESEYCAKIDFSGDSIKTPMMYGRSQGKSVALCANVGWSAWQEASKRSEILIAQRDAHAARIEWIEEVNTLHRKVEFLYVVDGYQATVTWDGEAISEDFHGETISEAIDKAMAGFDLNDRGKNCRTSKCEFSEVTHLYAIERQRDELLALTRESANWLREIVDCEEEADLLERLDAAIANCEVKS